MSNVDPHKKYSKTNKQNVYLIRDRDFEKNVSRIVHGAFAQANTNTSDQNSQRVKTFLQLRSSKIKNYRNNCVILRSLIIFIIYYRPLESIAHEFHRSLLSFR